MTQKDPPLIRPARSGDERALFTLVQELARFEHLEEQVTGSTESLAQELFGQAPAAWAIVAEEGETIVGYALCFWTYSTFLTRRGIWLEDIFVTETERGRGIGSALFDAVFESAKSREAGRLEWSVLDWNERAINFYRARGADVLPDWRICRIVNPA